MANTFVAKLAAFLEANPQGTAQAFAEHLDAQATAAAKDQGPKRPKAGTLTGKVWDIADALAAKGEVTRTAVRDAGREAGLNDATIATQYQAWKTARAATQKAEAAKPLTVADWLAV